MNLLIKTHDSTKHDKFANKKWKGVKSEKIKTKTCFADKDLSSWTGPEMTKSRLLVQFRMLRVRNWVFDEMSK